MTSPRDRHLLTGLSLRVIWTNMVSRTWGKWALAGIVALALFGPIAAIREFYAERSAVALVSSADSGGPVLVPARCGIPGPELNKDYIVADGKAVRGRATRRACFYTVSAFQRFFPDRFKNDDPATFRVQQLTTGIRLLSPSMGHAVAGLVVSVLAPFLFLVFAMAKSAIDLARPRKPSREGA